MFMVFRMLLSQDEMSHKIFLQCKQIWGYTERNTPWHLKIFYVMKQRALFQREVTRSPNIFLQFLPSGEQHNILFFSTKTAALSLQSSSDDLRKYMFIKIHAHRSSPSVRQSKYYMCQHDFSSPGYLLRMHCVQVSCLYCCGKSRALVHGYFHMIDIQEARRTISCLRFRVMTQA